MDCPDIVDLERYALRDLDARELNAIAAHLTSCASCQRELADLNDNLRMAQSLKRAASLDDGSIQALPQMIGPYRILRKLGQGGMGTVYEAEQENPKRIVALKVIRPELASPSLMSRFKHEAQMLGRLAHPGIAQVFEAGTATVPHGPISYLVMERVNGPQLIEFAESRQLSNTSRLLLMASICDAVQHAHQRGVIHRDLKPQNILVDESEGSPQPKILDFGVARLVDPDQRVNTLQTSPGQIVGTVAYMSPEQAGGDPRATDTRADVYALGVIAYQLLCGRLPYKLSQASVAESVRAIVQDEPTPLASVVRSLRGDVTTIVGKAMEKDKARRYQSAAEMAADIRHHLSDEPINAHAPSTVYQLKKFARRNRGLVAGVIAAFVVLIFGIIGTSVGLVRAQRARIAADKSATEARHEADKQAAVNSFLQEILGAANPRNLTAEDRAKGNNVTLLDAVNAAAKKVDAGSLKDQPEVEVAVRQSLGVTFFELAEYDAADRHLGVALDLARTLSGGVSKDVADVLNNLANLRQARGKTAEAERMSRQALEVSQKVFGREDRNVASCLNNLAIIVQSQGNYPEAEKLFRESLTIREKLLGPEHKDVATVLNNLGLLMDDMGRMSDAESMYQHALAIRRKALGEEHPDTAVVLNNLAFVLRAKGKSAEAEQMFRDVLAMRRKLFGEMHPAVAGALNSLGSMLQVEHKYEEAEPLYRRAIEIQQKVLGAAHPSLAQSINNLATLMRDEGKLAESESIFREALEMRRKTLGDNHPAVALGCNNLSGVLRDLGKFDEAEKLARHGLAIIVSIRGDESVDAGAYRISLASCLLAMKRYEEAERELLTAHRVLQPRVASGDTRDVGCVKLIIKLYTAWGKAGDAEKYRASLPASRPTTNR